MFQKFVRPSAISGETMAWTAPIKMTTTATNSLHVATTAAMFFTISSMSSFLMYTHW